MRPPQFSFRTGVYGPSLSFARSFPDDGGDGSASDLPGLHGVATHAGVLLASVAFSFAGRRVVAKAGHAPLVAAGLACHATCYVAVALNVPPDAPMGVTYGDALLVVPSR